MPYYTMDQSTIIRDVNVLKVMSQQFVFDLAKSDLASYYLQSINRWNRDRFGVILMVCARKHYSL